MKSSTLAVGRLTHHDAEENPVEVVAALDDKTGAGLRFATTRPAPAQRVEDRGHAARASPSEDLEVLQDSRDIYLCPCLDYRFP